MCCPSKGNALKYHVGMMFSTKDQDHDRSITRHCSHLDKGGWWYNRCGKANLNGQYLVDETTKNSGMYWSTWEGFKHLVKGAEMKIREHGARVSIAANQ